MRAGLARIRLHRNPPIEAERWVRDPRGLKILLTADIWRTHVLRRHRAQMEDRYESVVGVLENPAFITRSPWTPSIELYYGDEPQIRVVVRFTRPLEGEVVTAYTPGGPEEREKIVWTPC